MAGAGYMCRGVENGVDDELTTDCLAVRVANGLARDQRYINALSGALAGDFSANKRSSSIDHVAVRLFNFIATLTATLTGWRCSTAKGAITAALVCPLDLLKTRLQVQHSAHNRYSGIGGEPLASLLCSSRGQGLHAVTEQRCIRQAV